MALPATSYLRGMVPVKTEENTQIHDGHSHDHQARQRTLQSVPEVALFDAPQRMRLVYLVDCTVSIRPVKPHFRA